MFGLTSWPSATSSSASFSWLLETHISGRIGSPIVTGSTRCLRSSTIVPSVSVIGRRPPPLRRTRPGSNGGGEVLQAADNAFARDSGDLTAAMPPQPAARPSLAANRRCPRSSRFEPSTPHCMRTPECRSCNAVSERPQPWESTRVNSTHVIRLFSRVALPRRWPRCCGFIVK